VAGGPADIAAAFRTAECGLACLCGSDKRYAADAVLAALALRTAGAGRIYLAGKPGDMETTLRDAGIVEFIHVGVDMLASLELAHAELGLGA
jgi:methylmalonyl-CoA mutase